MNRPASALRRRVLRMVATAGGLTAAGLLSLPAAARAAVAARHWEGTALGGKASLTLYHHDGTVAENVIRSAVAELRRLETVFSLYREDSALVRLNREGMLEAPPTELVRLLSEARFYAELTGGAFDVTVQPLWTLYATHFAAPGADPAGPARADLEQALSLVDYRRVEVGLDRIAFARPGMAVTLNGIAQGFITDRVAELLRREGMDSVLVNLGEIRGVGRHPDGRAWQVGLEDPFDRSRIARKLEIGDNAVATSAGHGMTFDAGGRYHHLLDPHTGLSNHRFESVSVVAPTATAADALSTAMAGMDEARSAGLVRSLDGVDAYLTRADGEVAVMAG